MKQATARAAANWRRVYAMPVASVYPSYIAKAEKKGRTRAEVDEIFRWLTGHSQASLEAEFAKKTSFEDFFAHAPKMNPSRFLITGVVCGVRVEEIQEPMMREIRYLDKLIDELAKGKTRAKPKPAVAKINLVPTTTLSSQQAGVEPLQCPADYRGPVHRGVGRLLAKADRSPHKDRPVNLSGEGPRSVPLKREA